MWFKTILILSIGILVASCSVAPLSGASSSGYKKISIEELSALMDTEEFTLVNVHIPLEGNIPGTDAMIPFNEIENHLNELPLDKDAKIILYCRSGSMSRTATHTLIDLGYTNVFDLEGGYNAWVANDLPFEE